MKGMKYALAVCCIGALAGCASMFGPTTSDPAVKLQWAEENLVRNTDPAAAEKLIRDAMEIYEKKKDRPGLAEAYRQYGLFLRSYSVSNAAEYYTEEGFLDKTVRFNDRYGKAIEYFNMSRDLFADLGRYDTLASVYVSLAKTYDLTNRRDEACKAFDKSLESYARFKMAGQKTDERRDERRSEEIASYIDYVDAMKKQTECPAVTVPIISLPPAPLSPYSPPRDPAPAPTTAPATPKAISK